MSMNGKIYTPPETYSVLLSATKSQSAANAKHVLKDSYGVPEMVKDFEHMIGGVGHGVGNAYRDMNMYQKGLFWMFLFSMGGVALDTTLNNGKVTKDAVKYAEKGVGLGKAKAGEAGDFLQGVYKGITTKAPVPAVVAVDSVQKQLADAGIDPNILLDVGKNASAKKEHIYSPGIEIHGSDRYKEKILKNLEEIKRLDIDEYNDVMLYLEVLRDGPDDTVGKGVYTLTELALDRGGPSQIIHEKEHAKQNIEPTLSRNYKGRSGWYAELDAVKKQVDWETKVYEYTEEQKLQRFKMWIKLFEGAYPKEYAQFISRNITDI